VSAFELPLGYTRQLNDLEQLPGITAWLAEQVVELKRLEGVDTVVVVGVSGLIVGPAVAQRAGVNLLIVRKGAPVLRRDVSGRCGRRLLFVDDLIDTGKTYCLAISRVDARLAAVGRRASLAGALLYGSVGRGEPLTADPLTGPPRFWTMRELTAPGWIQGRDRKILRAARRASWLTDSPAGEGIDMVQFDETLAPEPGALREAA
jgi:hypothetical protein